MEVIFSPGTRVRIRRDLFFPDKPSGMWRSADSRGTVVSYTRINGNYMIQFDREESPREIFRLYLTELHPLEVLAEATE